MVRADLLDAIDDVLRRYKDRNRPFGGVQLLMIGDLHQLPPVVKENEWEILRQHYDTPYFFSSKALRETEPVSIELKHIYRQNDSRFIELLNKVRNNQLDASVLEQLNSRHVPDFQPNENDGYIILTSHNASAQEINNENLSALPGTSHHFQAEISGDFPEHAFPADKALALKIGAQVMFVKNDTSREKQYYNGKIGKVTDIKDGTIYVQCPGEDEPISVYVATWTNVKYTLNEKTKEVSEEEVGSFQQYPLRLAWAITIHKSQGLTFERAIIDAQSAFAHGQVYVALSRCKSFEGIVLRSPIAYSSVKTDKTVRNFSEEADRNTPDEAHLHRSKHDFQQSLIAELFNFSDLRQAFKNMNRVFLSHENALHADAFEQFKTLKTNAENDVLEVSDKFQMQLRSFFRQPDLPEENAELQERIQKACDWFLEKVSGMLSGAKQISLLTDNKSVQKVATEALETLQEALFIKHACLQAVQSGFATQHYIRAKADAQLDYKAETAKTPLAAKFAHAPKNATHPELYAQIKRWRDETAATENVEVYRILPTKSILELVELLPGNMAALKKVNGIGEVKSKRFGGEILDIIGAYCREKGLEGAQLTLAEKTKKPKADTKKLSFDLFQSGKSIADIAAERSLTTSTIEGHLAHFIEQGELDIFSVMDREKVAGIARYLEENPEEPLGAVKVNFGDDCSYGEIRMVQHYLKRNAQEDNI